MNITFGTLRSVTAANGLSLCLLLSMLPLHVSAQGAGNVAPAVVRANAEAEFSSSLSSKIDVLPFKEGSAFVMGDVLVALDCAVQMAEAEAASAEHKAAQAEFKAQQALLARGGVGKVQVEVAEAQAGATKARLQLAEAVVTGCEITAPFDGRIAEIMVNEFEYVEPSQPLLSVVSSARPELEINAPAVWLRWMDVGTEGGVRFEMVEGEFPIRITRLGAAIDPVSATIKVIAEFQGSVAEILPGMSGLVSFE